MALTPAPLTTPLPITTQLADPDTLADSNGVLVAICGKLISHSVVDRNREGQADAHGMVRFLICVMCCVLCAVCC